MEPKNQFHSELSSALQNRYSSVIWLAVVNRLPSRALPSINQITAMRAILDISMALT
ncbi:hypothetical protein [Noviherbaspirillum soli]|uniref:hypothetical protein n=1 Tax=Noviherbaspirillum soli TaxID=1064518 RepID=UPI00188D49A1|nr:hypothetical protein [Noviherbaspirillum soli]